jgi:hypothetical protein
MREALDAAFGGLPVGITTQPVVLRGKPGPALTGAARQAGDLLIIGAGRRGLPRRLAGWVSAATAWPTPNARWPPSRPRRWPSRAGHGLRGWAFRRRWLRATTQARTADHATVLTGPPAPPQRAPSHLTSREPTSKGTTMDRIGRIRRSLASQPTSPAAPSAAPAALNAPPTTTSMPRRHTVTTPGLLPRTILLCLHCQQNPAGFWVRRTSDQTARRPWCLSCCQQLDRNRCDVAPFQG